MSKNKKDNVHLKLSEELEGIDAELGDAMDALSATNERIDSFLNDDGEIPEQRPGKPAAEIPDEDEVDEGSEEHAGESTEETSESSD